MEKSSKAVYLDNAATTRISDTVFEGVLPYLKERYGNPSSVYSLGQESARAIEKSRERLASALNCTPGEIYFTGGGSESNNWAIRSCGASHIITSEFEHHAVLHVCENLEKHTGVKTTYLPVYANGIIKIEDLEKALHENPSTGLVTIMFANNEIGTIQPIAEIGRLISDWNKKNRKCRFHTDAVQAVGNVPIDVQAMNIDMLSLSGHKFHGMKGAGALYVRKGVKLPPFILGGAQERGSRAGTENVAGIVALGIAVEEAVGNLEEKNALLLKKRERIYNEVMKIERTRLNGDLEKRLSNNLNFSFEGIEGEALLLNLDLMGIAASSGSACTSGSLDPSHVLLALGLPHEIAHGSLRISMSRYTTDDEITHLLEVLPPIVAKLRAMSPVWENINV
ncbi:MAG: aminotransferase class V-fold PLP-dependent enzyme [Oscillospiraceae bacterium]|nr:aminotransferase class V-fold PLP-dependent enzyme [Oscillospiraceae bacterium]